ncbi:MAG: biotin--[Bacteroidaceae bacterium]|nr:biotin--[acetyl-CoA-carboxylase] ligase [Bacteroidaceae bacterium]
MIELDDVDSTNNYLRHLDMADDRRMTLVTAEFQSAGRGADTNRWESAKGENLLFSLRVMPSALPVSRMFALSEAAALAVRVALAKQCSMFNVQCSMFTVKWPNDVYYGDSKVAGILIENNLQGALVRSSIIGIGINVNQRRFLSDAPNPRSLADIVGHDVERHLVLERFMESFTHYINMIDGSDKSDQSDQSDKSDGSDNSDWLDLLHAEYKRHLYRFGEEHSYSDKDGTFRATLIDVEPSGHLILRDTEGKRRSYAFKEVKFGIEGVVT